MAATEQHPVRRLSVGEQERARAAIARVKQLRREILVERGGALFPDSAELINQARSERTWALMAHPDE